MYPKTTLINLKDVNDDVYISRAREIVGECAEQPKIV
jgi:hypothetical protein